MYGNTALGSKETSSGIEGFTSSYFNKPTGDRESLRYQIGLEVDKELAPPFSEISTGFAEGLTDLVYDQCAQESFPSRGEAIEYFNRNFMEREITRVKGNISQYVRDAFGASDDKQTNNLRRNVYRKIGKYGLHDMVDGARPWKPVEKQESITSKYMMQEDVVQNTLTSVLDDYSEKLHPIHKGYLTEKIQEKSGTIAAALADYMPNQENRMSQIFEQTEGITDYKQALQVFEGAVVYEAMEAAGFDKQKAAEYLGDSLRTLNRRIADLGIDEDIEAGMNVVSMEEFVRREQDIPVDEVVDAETERLRVQEMIRERNDSVKDATAVKVKQKQWRGRRQRKVSSD